jgi:hypothetical protein
MAKKSCSICASPIVDLINAELEKQSKMADIAKLSGFSKSAIGRHSLNCLTRMRIQSHASKKCRESQRVLTDLGGGKYFVQRGDAATRAHSTIDTKELRADDVIICVSSEDPVPPREFKQVTVADAPESATNEKS